MSYQFAEGSKYRDAYDAAEASMVNEEFKKRQDERRPFELQWRLNLAFIEGNQYVDINTAAQTLIEIPKALWWQEREAFNHVGPIIEARISRLARMHPILMTRPGTGEQSDIRAAKIGTHLLKNIYHDKSIQNKLQEAANWSEACGSVFFKNVWNPKLGPVVAELAYGEDAPGGMAAMAGTPQMPGMPGMPGMPQQAPPAPGMGMGPGEAQQPMNPLMGEGMMSQQDDGMHGMPQQQDDGNGMSGMIDELGPALNEFLSGQGTETLTEGDLEPIVVPPQEIFPDSCYKQGIADLKSIIHARAYKVSEIESTWGEKVAAENVTVMQLHRSMHGMGGLGYGSGSYHHSVTSLKNHALVKEYWERPSDEYPEGRLIIVAGSKVLYSGPMPFLVGEDGKPDLPFTKMDCIERPGVFWGRTVTERIIPVQRRYNALRNRKAEYLNRVAIGVFVVEDGSVDMDKMEQEAGAPGSIITFSKGAQAPKLMENQNLPFSFEKEEATLLQEFSQLSGVSELSRQSKADPGVKSGVALQLALDQDDTRLTSTAANIEQFMVDNGKQWLRLSKQFVLGPRILRIVGKNNMVEVIDWEGADIQSDDVIVEPYSATAESPQQRREMVYGLLQAGLFNDPETGTPTKEMKAKIFEMLQFGNWETGDDDEELHLSRAERENHSLTEGGQVRVLSYDDHILHIARHNKYRLTVDFEALLAENPVIDQSFDVHVQEHLYHMYQSMQQAAAPTPGQQQIQSPAGAPIDMAPQAPTQPQF